MNSSDATEVEVLSEPRFIVHADTDGILFLSGVSLWEVS